MTSRIRNTLLSCAEEEKERIILNAGIFFVLYNS